MPTQDQKKKENQEEKHVCKGIKNLLYIGALIIWKNIYVVSWFNHSNNILYQLYRFLTGKMPFVTLEHSV